MIQTVNLNEMNISQDNININQNPMSNYRKSLEVSNSKSFFLTGIEKLDFNRLNIFIPTIYLRKKDVYLKMLVYYYEEMIFFIFINDNYNVYNILNSLLKMDKWTNRYFKSHISILEKLLIQMMLKSEQYYYLYMNTCNKSMKFSSNILNNKKSSKGDFFKTEYLFFVLKNNFLHKSCSLTKLKQTYIYYNFSLDRRLILFFSENDTDIEIENAKKELFEKILMF